MHIYPSVSGRAEPAVLSVAMCSYRGKKNIERAKRRMELGLMTEHGKKSIDIFRSLDYKKNNY